VTRQPDFSTAPGASRVPAWQHVALAACALAALAAAAQAYATREEARGALRRLAEVSRDVDAARTRLQALDARARASEAGVLSPADVPPALVVSEVASLLPGDVRLDRLSIDYRRGGTLEMQVVAKDAGAWDRLLQQLEAAPRLREVELGPEARAAEVRSVVQARWASAPR
jgi:Tfp pilus assembly protein PilN